MSFKYQIICLFAFFILIFQFSCVTNDFYGSPDAKLNFSTDTVLFDTIFTSFGSATKQLVIKNPYSQAIKISNIRLARQNTPFKLNINGIPANSVTDMEIAAKDSMYIFVKVSIDPTNINSPLLEQDSIVFSVNGSKQDVDLVAWGQDVHLLRNKTFQTETLLTDKPYFVQGYMLVDTLQTLIIPAGAHLYFARNTRFWVKGTLKVQGTFENPVMLEGGRTEKMYSDVPGQWDGVYLMFGSQNNQINYATIKNAVIGIQADTVIRKGTPSLTLTNSRIEHHSYAGVLARGTELSAFNCLFADCGEYALALIYGGSYQFFHCTIGNYWTRIRTTPSLFLNNYYTVNKESTVGGTTLTEKVKLPLNLEKATFTNCIIFGNTQNEILTDLVAGAQANYLFENCVLKYTADAKLSQNNLKNCVINYAKFKFKAPYEPQYNFELDTLSPAKDAAKIETVYDYFYILEKDLKSYGRLTDSKPDIGALERKE
jgi:hypothetical protein